MEYPKSVDETAELAEELHKKLFPDNQQEENQEEEEEQESANEDVETDNEIPHDDDVEELRKFKSKYLTLQGKYDAEVPRLHSELRELKQNIFERLEEKRVPQQEEPEQDKFAKFKEEYGEELFEAMREIARLESGEQVKETIKTMSEHLNSVEETQIKAAQNNFMNYLDSQVTGDWRKLWSGEDAKFMDFLQTSDPSGLYTYGDLVQMYNDNWDADKLTKVFNTYFDSSKESAPKPKQPRPEQTAMVAPSRQNVSPPTMNDKRIWTKEAMKEFELKDRQGKYSPEESQAMWEDLLLAANEGRIR